MGASLPDLRRVLVVGTSCAGKSTFGRRLAPLVGADLVELDDFNWLPGWRQRDPDEFRHLVVAATAGERWCVVGNYLRAGDVTWGRATAVVWLDVALPRLLWRAVHRTVRRSITREPCCNGNVESLGRALGPEGIPWWVLRSHRRTPHELAARLAEGRHRGLAVLRLRSPADVERFLARVAAPASLGDDEHGRPSSPRRSSRATGR